MKSLRMILFLSFALSAGGTTPEWRNIRDFGAVGDGQTDDTAAVQAAFDSLDPVMGGTVYCPPGTYAIYSQIKVATDSVRLVGDAGSAYNEDTGTRTGRGCSFWARTERMTLMRFDSGSLNFRGPVIEYVNFREVTPTGNTTTLIWIYRYTRWTLRNVYVGYADVGLKVDGGAGSSGDASWGYLSQLICRRANTCVDEPNAYGGFVAVGGSFEPLVNGVHAAGDQVRIIGAKFDCVNGATGVLITGGANVVDSSLFEQCGTSVKLASDGTSGSGSTNRIIGNHFRQWDGGPSVGVDVGSGTTNNQLIGNTYTYFGRNALVNDQGTSTKRFEQGMGATMTLT
jgi:Pectate lyase superfamily protein